MPGRSAKPTRTTSGTPTRHELLLRRQRHNGADDPSGSITSATTRGFTGQEELSVNGLVHLNGRVYDSLLGRMMSADPTVPDPYNPQAWNRYSYVGNDPLTFTDPTGFSWLSSFFSSIGNFFRSIFSNSIVRAIAQIVIAAILIGNPLTASVAQLVFAAAASAAVVTGLSGGKLGQILKAGLIAGATALAFNRVAGVTGDNPPFGTPEFFENVAGHAAVGCLSAVASGGQCGPGALSGAVPAAAAPLVGDIVNKAPDSFTRTIEGSAASGVLGGLASVAGGGKFADGAVTGAFGYLFNSGAGNLSKDLAASRACDAQCVAQGNASEQALVVGLASGLAFLPFAVIDTLVTGAEFLAAEGAGIVGRFSPINPGPLAESLANTFRSATYEGSVLSEDTTLYRVIGDSGNPGGAFWTRVQPGGPLQSVIDLGLDQTWGNTATTVITRTFPAGTQIFEGAAAAQRGLVGGGNQIYIPGLP
jgi:RHS repeat-associated protein